MIVVGLPIIRVLVASFCALSSGLAVAQEAHVFIYGKEENLRGRLRETLMSLLPSGWGLVTTRFQTQFVMKALALQAGVRLSFVT